MRMLRKQLNLVWQYRCTLSRLGSVCITALLLIGDVFVCRSILDRRVGAWGGLGWVGLSRLEKRDGPVN